ncbi:hypothetical protein [Deinococcus sp. PESE-13]
MTTKVVSSPKYIGFDAPVTSEAMGTTFWMGREGKLVWTARDRGEPFSLGWRLYLITPEQRVDILLNGKKIQSVPVQGDGKWLYARSSLVGRASLKGKNTIAFRAKVLNTPQTPMQDVPEGRSILFDYLQLRVLASVSPNPGEQIISLLLAATLILSLFLFLRLNRGRHD